MKSRTDALWIKICGITRPIDAVAAEHAGADAIGVNFVPSSPRLATRREAEAIRDAVSRVEIVGVVADAQADWMRELLDTGLVDRLQLHGHESDEDARSLGDRAFRAIRIASPTDVEHARRAAGHPVLLDAAAGAQLGGTGHPFDWGWIESLAKERAIVVAGGLRPENIAVCIDRVRPFGVDVASGVELPHARREKDPARIQAFVRNAREAAEKPT